MPLSEKKKLSNDKYIKATFDEIKLRVPKGRKAELQARATACGESLNGYINRMLDGGAGESGVVIDETV
jgi:predicted HicB family RNase H-like nuclease